MATDQNLPANPQPTKSKAVAASVTGGATVTTAALAKDSEVCTTGFHSCNFSPRLSQVEEEESQGEDRQRVARVNASKSHSSKISEPGHNYRHCSSGRIRQRIKSKAYMTSSKSSSTSNRTSCDKLIPKTRHQEIIDFCC